MIVDVHTQVWDTPEQLGAAAAARLWSSEEEPWDRHLASTNVHDEAMAAVDVAVILGFESRLLGASIPAAQVARYVARRPGKYVGFAGVDPTSDDDGAAQLDTAVRLGLSGVVLSPAAQGFHPGDPSAAPLYDRCAAAGLAVMVLPGHDLGSRTLLEFAQPVLLDHVARAHPTLRMVIGGLGWPWVDQTMALCAKHEHVYADLAGICADASGWRLYNTLRLAHEHGVSHKLLFGSGFPALPPGRAIEALYTINALTHGSRLPLIPRESLGQIVHRDALACLGIRRPAAAAGPAKISEASDN